MIRRVRYEWNIRENFTFLSVLTFAGEIITTEDNTPLEGGSTPADWYNPGNLNDCKKTYLVINNSSS